MNHPRHPGRPPKLNTTARWLWDYERDQERRAERRSDRQRRRRYIEQERDWHLIKNRRKNAEPYHATVEVATMFAMAILSILSTMLIGYLIVRMVATAIS